jgi:hypothetical protein
MFMIGHSFYILRQFLINFKFFIWGKYIIMNDTYTFVFNSGALTVINPNIEKKEVAFNIDWTGVLPQNINKFKVEFSFLGDQSLLSVPDIPFEDISISTNFESLVIANQILGYTDCILGHALLYDDNAGTFGRHVARNGDNKPVTISRPTSNLIVRIKYNKNFAPVPFYLVNWTLTLHFTPIVYKH